MNDKIRQLEALIIDNPWLEQLKNLIAEFNIFEAMGAVRQELRHSDFLAFLLNPTEKHGLGDTFLKRFLIRVLTDADDAPISPITIELTNLSECVVERETQNIDILVHDSRSGLVCIIENKIFTSEHDDQLNRYLQIVKRRFPLAETIIPILLTPDGVSPGDENSLYIPLSYGQVAEIMENVRLAREVMFSTDINTMVRHYVTMLRRHIVSDSDIARLCRQVYRTHKAAIDLIIEHMPDLRQELTDYLVGLISNTPYFKKVRFSKSYIDFMLQDWVSIPEFNVGVGWPNSQATLAFEFSNAANQLNLYLELGPVEDGQEYIRKSIFVHANNNRDIFRGCRPQLSKKWSVLYKMPLLSEKDYQDASLEDLIQIIKPKLERFSNDVLPQINQQLMQVKFT